MAVNTTTWESTLQSKLNDTTLTSKDMLLVGKTLEATTGNIAVSDINDAGAVQVAAINTVATNTFKTVGGTSVLGSGDIATLPSQSGASGKVLKSDGTTAAWGEDVGGTLKKFSEQRWSTRTSAPGGSGYQVFYTTNYTKTNAGCSVLIEAEMPAWQGSNGGGTYWISINNGSWLWAGGHTYVGTYMMVETLRVLVPDANMNVGVNSVRFASNSYTGKNVNMYNPNGSDHSEMATGTTSIFHYSELDI